MVQLKDGNGGLIAEGETVDDLLNQGTEFEEENDSDLIFWNGERIIALYLYRAETYSLYRL